MYKSVTPIKVEPVNDGSIFVCFLCEKEFTQVSYLNMHMTQHADPLDDPSQEEIVVKDVQPIRIKLKKEKKKRLNTFFPSSPKKLIACNQNITDEKIQIVKKKTSAEIAANRARKVQMYIQAQEKKSNGKKKPVQEESSNNDDISNNSQILEGPSDLAGTVISFEPEGFVCPKETLKSPHKFSSDVVPIQQNATVEDEPADEEFNFFSEGSVSKYMGARVKDHKVSRYQRGRPPLSRSPPELWNNQGMDSLSDGNFIANPLQGGPSHKLSKSAVKSVHPCPECSKTFSSLQTLRIHLKSHFEVKEILCPMCQEVFPQRYILYEHIANDHEEAIEFLVCSICHKMFTRPDSLKTHMVRMHNHSGGLNCMICGKNFPSQAQLEIHVRVHTGERPYQCIECGRDFVQKVHLKTHLRTMHNIEESVVTPCRLCGKLLQGRTVLREHYLKYHEMSTAQYRTEVMRMRREGKLPEKIPPTVKVVSPNFTYKNVSISEVTDRQSPIPFQNKGITRLQRTKSKYSDGEMGKIMNPMDDVMFSPNDISHNVSTRNEDELKLVESAFQVAEEMDLMGEDSSALMVPADEASTSGIYYSLPDMIDSTSLEKDEDELAISEEELMQYHSGGVDQRDRMVMAAPLEAVDGTASGEVEMFSM